MTLRRIRMQIDLDILLELQRYITKIASIVCINRRFRYIGIELERLDLMHMQYSRTVARRFVCSLLEQGRSVYEADRRHLSVSKLILRAARIRIGAGV